MPKSYKEGIKVEHLGGTRVKFIFPCGHADIKDFSKGKLSQRMGEAGVRLMIPYWNDRITATCRKCK
jgi:hypothetical protein